MPIGNVGVLAVSTSDEVGFQALVDSCNGSPDVSLTPRGSDGLLEIEAETTQPWIPTVGCADLVSLPLSDGLEDWLGQAPISGAVTGNAFFGYESQISGLSLRLDTVERMAEFEQDGIWDVSVSPASEPLASAVTTVRLDIEDGIASVCTLDDSLPTPQCRQPAAGLGEVALETEVLRLLANFGSVEVSGDAGTMTWRYEGLVLELWRL